MESEGEDVGLLMSVEEESPTRPDRRVTFDCIIIESKDKNKLKRTINRIKHGNKNTSTTKSVDCVPKSSNVICSVNKRKLLPPKKKYSISEENQSGLHGDDNLENMNGFMNDKNTTNSIEPANLKHSERISAKEIDNDVTPSKNVIAEPRDVHNKPIEVEKVSHCETTVLNRNNNDHPLNQKSNECSSNDGIRCSGNLQSIGIECSESNECSVEGSKCNTTDREQNVALSEGTNECEPSGKQTDDCASNDIGKLSSSSGEQKNVGDLAHKANVKTKRKRDKAKTGTNNRKKKGKSELEKYVEGVKKTKSGKTGKKSLIMKSKEIKYLSDDDSDGSVKDPEFKSKKADERESTDEMTEISEGSDSVAVEKSEIEEAKKKKKKKYPCSICDKRFSSKSNLESHAASHGSAKRYKCEMCGKQYTWQSSLRIHVATHANIEKHKCTTCGRVLGSSTTLQRHMERMHLKPEKNFACDLCSKTFLYSYELKYHKDNHFAKRVFVCEYCAKIVSSKSDLESHIRTHTGEKPFVCDMCGKAFAFKTLMKQHFMLHIDGNSFQCEVCGKQFSAQRSLARHSRLHTEEKPYKCNMCTKTFKSPSALSNHKDFHLGVKRHMCEHCGKLFQSDANMHKHKKRHLGIKNELCEICGKGFITKQEVQMHMRSHTGEKKRTKAKREEDEEEEVDNIPPYPMDINPELM